MRRALAGLLFDIEDPVYPIAIHYIEQCGSTAPGVHKLIWLTTGEARALCLSIDAAVRQLDSCDATDPGDCSVSALRGRIN